jgi:beta-glucanase (GH16 family)
MKIFCVLCLMGCALFNTTPPKEKYKLVWSDEFSKDGAPDPLVWQFDMGNGSDGWGNHEVQYYTNESSNVKVKDGKLIITAINNNGNWTSARVKTQGKKSWRYSKVVFRAKLPTGRGTWPALWMLGENVSTKGWPACGEIDVMEHVGRDPGIVQCALHSPASHGNTIHKQSTPLPTFDSEFHNFEVNWDHEKIDFSVDGKLFYTYAPDVKDESTWPYDQPFFLIMNIAMGGGLGGPIDPALKTAVMEVDYVRVYEKKVSSKKKSLAKE